MARRSGSRRKKRKYPTTWRESSRVYLRLEVYMPSHLNHPPRIVPVYEVSYKRRVGPRENDVEFERHEQRGHGLDFVMSRMAIPEKQGALLDLTFAGLAGVERLFSRFEWVCRVKADKERKKERLAAQKKRDANSKTLSEEREHKELMRQVDNKQFVRRVDA